MVANRVAGGLGTRRSLCMSLDDRLTPVPWNFYALINQESNRRKRCYASLHRIRRDTLGIELVQLGKSNGQGPAAQNSLPDE